MVVPSHSKDTDTYKKICIITKDCLVGEVVESFQEAFGWVKEHQNTRLIQAAESQTDINHHQKNEFRRLAILWHFYVNCKLKRWEHCGPQVLISSHVQCIIIQTKNIYFWYWLQREGWVFHWLLQWQNHCNSYHGWDWHI